mgnify:CR=1 FL=1
MKKIKVGRNKNIQTPELMYKYFKDYVKETKSNPFFIKDWVGKDSNQIKREKEKPLTMEGFENYCFEKKIINDLGDYFSNKDERYNEFATICSRIRKLIRQDQIEGGMANIYNSSITQRLNGLVDKQEIETKIEQPLFTDIDYSKLSTETLNDILSNSKK